ncbi:MAG TPA: hypothetical protein DEB46_11260 [Myxococcales bacterium]|nr:hypothetical protein [Myxococcales bacterium]
MNNAHQAARRAIKQNKAAIPPQCLGESFGFGAEGAQYREEMQILLEDLVPGPGWQAKAQDLQELMVRYKGWLDGYVQLYGMRWSQ